MVRINITILLGIILAVTNAVLLIKNVLINYKLSDSGIRNITWILLVVIGFVCATASITEGVSAQSLHKDAMNSVGYFRDMYYHQLSISGKAIIIGYILLVIERILFRNIKIYMDNKIKNRKDSWNLNKITKEMK